MLFTLYSLINIFMGEKMKKLILILSILLCLTLTACSGGDDVLNGEVLPPIEMPEKEECAHSFSEWESYNEGENISCEKRLFYRICAACKIIEWSGGDYNSHKFETVTTPSTCISKGYDMKICCLRVVSGDFCPESVCPGLRIQA